MEALFASLKVAPRNLDLYAELARRLEAQGDPTGAERALTSMVEVEPNEAEGHRRLAKVRAEQKRDAAAVVQWRQVVRVRSLEPDGWLSLASAQIDAGQLDEAAKTLQHVLSTKWEARFQDVHRKARALQDRLRRAG
ncbi:MAG: tetratricopeptide repeat protein [Planctomycetes bacterium]|nr:tetratricopeptide repeat protein [Planctomycetota bacterium]